MTPWISYPVIGLIVVGITFFQFAGNPAYIMTTLGAFILLTAGYERLKPKILPEKMQMNASQGIIVSLLSLALFGWIGLLVAVPVMAFFRCLIEGNAIGYESSEN